jgi:hypothetical protein
MKKTKFKKFIWSLFIPIVFSLFLFCFYTNTFAATSPLKKVGGFINSIGTTLTSISNGLGDGWVIFTEGIFNDSEDFITYTKEFVQTTFNNGKENPITKVNDSLPKTKQVVNRQDNQNISKSIITTSTNSDKVTKILAPTKTVRRILESEVSPSSSNHTDNLLLSRIEGIEKAIANLNNSISRDDNYRQINAVYDSVRKSINNSSSNITENGTLNNPNINNPNIDNANITNFTATGQGVFTRISTLPHIFTSWPSGVSNISDSTFYINPSSVVADSNLFGLAVDGQPKFIVDAEGDIYGNNLILTGSTSTGSTSVGGNLSVQDNTILGDAPTDTLTINSATGTFANDTNFSLTGGVNGLSFDTDTLSIDSENHRIGIGKTSPSQKLDVAGNINIPSGSAYMYDGGNILFSNTALSNFFAGGAGNMTMTGDTDIGIGTGALASNTTGFWNVAIGTYALTNNIGGYRNVAIGRESLNSNTTGSQNTAIGSRAIYSNTTGNYNTANGFYSLWFNTSGNNNTASGANSLYYISTGSNNTASGYIAGQNISDGTTRNQTSNNSLYLGYDTRALANGDTNEIVIGASAIGLGSNSVVLGNSSITTTALRGNVGIGTTSPSYLLDVDGALNIKGENPIRLNGVWLMSWDIANTQMIIGSNYSGHGADVRFDVASVPGAMLIQQTTGNVGIGTTSPDALLHLKAPAGVQGLKIDGNNSYELYFAGSNANIYSEDDQFWLAGPSKGLRFGSNGINSQLVLQNGLVGIGTTSPSSPLTVNAIGPQIRIETTTDPTRYYTTLESLYNAYHPFSLSVGIGGTAVERIGVYGDAGSGANPRVVISANLAVGTAYPTNVLSLGGNVPRTIWMERNLTAATAGQGLTLSSGGSYSGGTDLAGGDLNLKSGISTGTGTSALRFFTATAGTTGATDNTPTEKMTILGNGNVGIGTTSPSSKLQINSGTWSPSAPPLKIYNGAYTYNFGHSGRDGSLHALEFYANGNAANINWNDGGPLSIGTSGAQPLNLYTSDINRLAITGSGNVGIGTTTPNDKLTIGIQDGSGLNNISVPYLSVFGGNTSGSALGSQGVNAIGYYMPSNSQGNSILRNSIYSINYTTKRNLYNGLPQTSGYTLASTEESMFLVNMSTKQWPTGALILQREFLVTQPTYSFVGASTITDAATVGIAGAPIGSTNATLTNTHGLLINIGVVTNSINSYGITVNAQTGATNNYAAAFMGGNVGIGTTAPTAMLSVGASNQFTVTSAGVVKGISFYSTGVGGSQIYLNSANNFGTIQNDTSDVWSLGYRASQGGLGTPVLSWNTSGNVGIGMTVPIGKVHTSIDDSTVYSGSSQVQYGNGLVLENTNSTVGSYTGIYFLNRSSSVAMGRIATVLNGANDSDMIFATESAGVMDERLRIKGSNVGIGTTNPMASLDVGSGTISIGTKNSYELTSALDITFVNQVVNNIVGTGGAYFGTTDIGAIDKGGSIYLGGSKYTASTNKTAFGSISGRKENANNNNSAGYLQFATSAVGGTTMSEWMRITSTGNVGIGTTSPFGNAPNGVTKGLEINGNSSTDVASIRLRSSPFGTASTGGLNVISMYDTGHYDYPFYSGGNSDVAFGFARTPGGLSYSAVNLAPYTLLTIKGNGNVGIGTTSPGNRLTIQQSGNTSTASVGIVSINSADDTYIGLGYNSTSDTNRIVSSYGSTGAYKPISFWTSDSERMRIDNSGNVGIGTTNPANKLVVLSASTTTAGLVVAGGGSMGTGNLDSGEILIGGSAPAQGRLIYNYQNGYLYLDNSYNNDGANIYFRTKTASTPVNAMTILGNGNVGIGTTNPSNQLTVGTNYSPAFSGNGITFGGGGSRIISVRDTTNGIEAGMKAGSDGVIYLGSASVHPLHFTINTVSKMVIDTAGNVGIGTTSPSLGKLQLGDGGANTTLAFNLGANNTYSSIQTYNSSLALNPSGNNVGIGTTSPLGKLDIRGDIFTDRWLLRVDNTFLGIGVVGAGNLANTSGTEGYYNTAIGAYALYSNTTGQGNTGIGLGALYYNQTGLSNVAVGRYAGQGVVGYSNSNNTFIGYRAGDSVTTGSSNIIIGDGADLPTPSTNSHLNIGNTIYGNLSTGNVGIGTTTPTADFQIGDYTTIETMKIAGGNGNDTFLKFREQSDNYGVTIKHNAGTDGGGLDILMNQGSDTGTSAMYIVRTTGNVGIGTTTPTYKLDVVGGARFSDSFYVTGGGAGITRNSGTGTSALAVTQSGTGNLLSLFDGATEAVTVLDGGNVGIGMTNPGYNLTVGSTLKVDSVNNRIGIGIDPSIYTLRVSGSVYSSDYFYAGTRIMSPLFRAPSNDMAISAVSSSNSISFGYGTEIPLSGEWMKLNSTGLGIGTTSPSAKLNVVDSTVAGSNWYKPLLVYAPNIGTGEHVQVGFGVANSAYNQAEFNFNYVGGTGSTSNTFSLGLHSAADILTMNGSNNVGINNTSPSVALDVTGDIEYTGTITDVSDSRLKENISEITGSESLSIINLLQAKSFNMIGSDKREYGFIAQEVQSVFPDSISIIDPVTGYLGINYLSFTPLMIGAIKEMNLKVDELSSLDTTLENSLGSLVKKFLTDEIITIKDFTTGLLHINGDVCVDDVCITKEEFKQMLINAKGRTSSGTSTPQADVTPEVPEDTTAVVEPIIVDTNIDTTLIEPPVESTPVVETQVSTTNDTPANTTPTGEDLVSTP